MTWKVEQRKSQDVLQYARAIPRSADFILLYSAMQGHETGRISILAFNPLETISADNIDELNSVISSDKPFHENAWFGYIAYECAGMFEDNPSGANPESYIKSDRISFSKYADIIIFNHENGKTTHYFLNEFGDLNLRKAVIDCSGQNEFDKNFAVSEIHSNFTRKQYEDGVAEIIQAIADGRLYQANLTRKFWGELEEDYDGFDIFVKLCEASKAPYSCFLRASGLEVISSSMERFLTLSPDGRVETRPIKGTLNSANDASDLFNSEKNRAENLMIVDLMRNDLSKVSELGTVKVEKLFEITSYPTVHHMSSTVAAQIMPDKNAVDLIKACFPPGSMTGAPKLAAMKLCAAKENMQRGIYSGSIGFLGGDGSVNLSVVIRTIIKSGRKFEFQVGGGIVYDSTPESEFFETISKSSAICKVLNIG